MKNKYTFIDPSGSKKNFAYLNTTPLGYIYENYVSEGWYTILSKKQLTHEFYIKIQNDIKICVAYYDHFNNQYFCNIDYIYYNSKKEIEKIIKLKSFL